MTGRGPLDRATRLPGATRSDRDHVSADALTLDRYLDLLLASGDRGAAHGPVDAALDPHLRSTAARLRTDLVRFHPSFRFEERVAGRLADLAGRMRLAAAAGAEGADIPSSGDVSPAASHGLPLPELGAIADGRLDPSAPDGAPMPRTVLIGGAMASALSIAGVAYVAWRVTRPPRAPMARAVRAARLARRDAARRRDRAGAAAWRRAARVVRPS